MVKLILLLLCISDLFAQLKDTRVSEMLYPTLTGIRQMSGGTLGVKVPVVILDTDSPDFKPKENVMGSCLHKKGKYNAFNNIVVISKEFWIRLDKTGRIVLLAHELIHCECGSNAGEHDNTKLADGCPKSIMSAVDANAQCYKKHLNNYLNQMKLGCDYKKAQYE